MGEMNSLRNLHVAVDPPPLEDSMFPGSILTFAASNQAGSGEPSGSATSVELVTGLSQNYSTRPPDQERP